MPKQINPKPMKKLTVLIVLALVFTAGCVPTKDEESPDTQSGLMESESLIGEKSPEEQPMEDPITQPTMKLTPESGDTIAILKTNHGDITMLLYTEKVPETAKNFIELANADKYDGVIFHRIIDDFMVQTGDFENMNGTGGHSYKGPGTALEDEFGEGLEHKYGAVSMANAGPNTGSSQFFIVQAKDGTSWLDGAHAIFGYVYEGMDVVEKIANAEKDGADKPLEDVVIENVVIEEYK